MITNVPSADGLNSIALRLYFSAWVSLVRIYEDFNMVHEPAVEWSPNWPDTCCEEEWPEYVASCQPDFHAICTVIQQSQELALKARVAAVSPYLLLLRADARFSQSVKDVDFSTLRTLDAIDLPGAVNTLCKDTLSGRFTQTYERVRALRNQIAHLGAPSLILEPQELIGVLIEQFAEVWPSRRWLHERLTFAATSRLGFFHDGSNTSAAMEVMQEMPFTLGMLKPAHFKRLFGHPKRTRRYLCLSCLRDATTDYAELDLAQCTTAFLSPDRKRIECAMCGNVLKVVEGRCGNASCSGTIQCSDGACLTCGE